MAYDGASPFPSAASHCCSSCSPAVSCLHVRSGILPTCMGSSGSGPADVLDADASSLSDAGSAQLGSRCLAPPRLASPCLAPSALTSIAAALVPGRTLAASGGARTTRSGTRAHTRAHRRESDCVFALCAAARSPPCVRLHTAHSPDGGAVSLLPFPARPLTAPPPAHTHRQQRVVQCAVDSHCASLARSLARSTVSRLHHTW